MYYFGTCVEEDLHKAMEAEDKAPARKRAADRVLDDWLGVKSQEPKPGTFADPAARFRKG